MKLRRFELKPLMARKSNEENGKIMAKISETIQMIGI